MKKLILFDANEGVASAYRQAFADAPEVEVVRRRFDDLQPTDELVSPANSFGFMDGGIDYAYSLRFGWHVQRRLQAIIQENHGGELLVGQAARVETDDEKFPTLIAAPTMRIPSVIHDPTDVYLAAKAALRVAQGTVAMPGMGTGCGRIRPQICASMVRLAYDHVTQPQPFPRNWSEAAQAARRQMLSGI